MLFFILILIIAAAAALARQIRIVPHQMTYVIERFGKYYDTWEDGLHVKMPIADRIVKKVSKKERVYDFPPQDVITKDNVTISIDSVVYASVFDPQSYTYSIDNPILGLQNLTATTLRSIIGSIKRCHPEVKLTSICVLSLMRRLMAGVSGYLVLKLKTSNHQLRLRK